MNFADNLEHLNPDLNAEAMARVNEIIRENQGKPGCLIPVLTECQRAVGYLPVELQQYIGQGLNIPVSTIYGVVTFYSFFTMVPRGRHTIKVCLGTACYVRGTKSILKKITDELHLEVGQTAADRRFSLEAVRCLGACGLAPAVVVDQDTHGRSTTAGIMNILNQYE